MRYDEDGFGAEDEVFALNGVGGSSSEDDDGDGSQEEVEIDEEPSSSGPSTGSGVKSTKTLKPSPMVSDSDKDSDDSEEEEAWGTKKSAYYSANDAHFDSENKEANELEEKEARRLQMKARDGMEDEDFGLDNLQALAEDGRMEPDVTEYVSFCSFARFESPEFYP
jgi:U3 small nucleolar RNA-associated protein 3